MQGPNRIELILHSYPAHRYGLRMKMSSGKLASFSGLQHLKEQLPEMKIIALGCHEVFDEIMGNFLAAGFDGYWNKYDNWAGLLKQLKILFPRIPDPI